MINATKQYNKFIHISYMYKYALKNNICNIKYNSKKVFQKKYHI